MENFEAFSLPNCECCGGKFIKVVDDEFKCDHCGNIKHIQTKFSSEIVSLFNEANILRNKGEFDDAMDYYKIIIQKDNNNIEAYYGVALCEFGIMHVLDPVTNKYKPTCNRAIDISLFDDENIKSCFAFASENKSKELESKINEIESIRKNIINLSKKEKPYDIFICYKRTSNIVDGQESYTSDSVAARDIYDLLTSKGYKVFFAEKSLLNVAGDEYEPLIYNALTTSKVMLVVGSNGKYLNSPWVKNEWTRFIKQVEFNSDKKIIPILCGGMSAYQLPDRLKNFQALSINTTFESTILANIEKIFKKEEPLVNENQNNDKTRKIEKTVQPKKFSLKKLLLMVAIPIVCLIACLAAYIFTLSSSLGDEPISISKVEQLKNIDPYKDYELVCDIDLSNTEWVPIQNYYGNFDGKGHTIKGLTITTAENSSYLGQQYNIGLFSTLSGYVKNLNLTDVNITILSSTSQISVGAIAGELCASNQAEVIENSGKLESISVSGLVNCPTLSNVGGIVGFVKDDCTLADITSEVNVTGNQYVGGVAGKILKSSTCNNIISRGTINAISTVGGIFGSIELSDNLVSRSFTKLTNYGNVICSDSLAAGIAGSCVNDVRIDNLSNSGNIQGLRYVGGILASYGYNNQATIQNLSNSGSVTAEEYAGGLFGSLLITTGKVTFNNISNTGNISANEYCAGGFIGILTLQDNGNIEFSVYTQTGNVNSTEKAGETVGLTINTNNNENDETDVNSYIPISSADDLRNILPNCNYILENDIDLSSFEWTPLDAFTGVFNGNNKTISGLTIISNNSHQNSIGLFSSINGSVFDLTLENVTITLSDFIEDYKIGALAGLVETNSTNPASIRNVTINSGSITAQTAIFVGGVVGYSLNSQLQNLTNKATISGFTNVGGICGFACTSTTAYKLTNYGAINGSTDIGGVIGCVSTIQSAVGSFTYLSNYGIVNSSGNCAGGVIGILGNQQAVDASIVINNLYNYEQVSAKYISGGIIAQAFVSGTVNYYNFTNTKKVSGEKCVGGIFGILKTKSGSCRLTNLSNSGMVDAGLGIAGGMVGKHLKDNSPLTFSGASQTGELVGQEAVGFLIGNEGFFISGDFDIG